MKHLLYILLFFLPVVGWGQVIDTWAGSGCGFSGNNGPAINALLKAPACGVFDSHGNFYFVERQEHCVRKISNTGIISMFAGTGSDGFSGDGGLATTAMLDQPIWVTVDAQDNIYIADGNNHRVRKVNGLGIISTVAGNGSNVHSGDGGQATNASIGLPMSVGFLTDGSMLILESGVRIRKVNNTGIITTIIGDGVAAYSGDNGPAITASIHAQNFLVDSLDNVFIADLFNYRIRKVEYSSGIMTTIAGTGQPAFGGDGGPAISAQLKPQFLTFDKGGNMFIADGNQRVRKIDIAGIISTVVGTGVPGFSGDGGPADSAQIYNPEGVCVDTCGNLYVTLTQNCRIRKVTFNDSCGTLNVRQTTPLTLTLSPNPATSQITISSTSKLKEIFVYSMLGSSFVPRRVGTTADEAAVTLDIEGLPPGVYFVKVRDVNGAIRTEKIIKQ